MSLKLYNSLTRKIEEFTPINPPNVGMYTCGPTVYDHMHIGNLRTFLMSDILSRVLTMNGFKVTTVQNITDIDDKIIKRAKEKNLSVENLSEEYIKYFLEDIKKLNILPVNHQPKATEHVGKMIKYIEELIKKGLAYIEKDGSVYFDISKFPNYGKLSQLDKRQLKTGTRVLSDEYSKDDIQDFALWKSVEGDEVFWDSPWGKGRPGWHIECSVMSQEYLSAEQNQTIDIHAGGIDLMFPHHENEIAQSEGKTGKKFVNYFIHGEHLLVNGVKMAKSAGNFFTLREIEEKGFDPLSFRYLILTAHYRDKLNFTWESLQAAQNALNHIRDEIRGWELFSGLSGQAKDDASKLWQSFVGAANNDLNTPQAVGVMHELISSIDPTSSKSRVILEMDKILGLGLEKYLGKPLEIPKQVTELISQREKARLDKDFKKSDQIRKQIKNLGFEIEDTPNGPKVKGVY